SWSTSTWTRCSPAPASGTGGSPRFSSRSSHEHRRRRQQLQPGRTGQVRRPGPALVGPGRPPEAAARTEPGAAGLRCCAHAPGRRARARRGLRRRAAERGNGRSRRGSHRARPVAGAGARGPAAREGVRRAGRLPRAVGRVPRGRGARQLRCRHLHGDARARARSRLGGGRLRAAAAAGRAAVPVDAQPHPGRVRAGDPGCRVHRPPAAAWHPSVPRLHPPLRAGRDAARGRDGAGGRERAGVRALAQCRAGDPAPGRQLPGLRPQAGRVLMAAGLPDAVLFDLDGTLLDSAPDMLVAANAMRARGGTGPMLLAELRPHVSRGARAMISAAFPGIDEATREAWVPEFLESYQAELGRHCSAFDGIERLLSTLEAAGRPWGIVTNKPEFLAIPLLPMLGWQERCAVLVGGDTLPVRKPDPAPLLHAAGVLGIEPRRIAYVGDDERDIVASRAAGMPSVVALWGYRLGEDDPFSWRGDVMVEAAADLCEASAWPAA